MSYFDANNYRMLRYDGATGRFEFIVRRAGNSYTAYLVRSVTAGEELLVRGRWTGSRAENGVTAYTIDVAVNGVLGTSANAGGVITEASPATLYVGTNAGTNPWGGEVWDVQSVAWVPTDEEMGRDWNG
jgi:hypothetical protein